MSKCNKCGRKVNPTTHSVDGVKVDYYTSWEVGKKPKIHCADCYKKD